MNVIQWWSHFAISDGRTPQSMVASELFKTKYLYSNTLGYNYGNFTLSECLKFGARATH